ncbi:Excreted virulence factor EspC, type VII ESX diderm [Lentzea albidocapillata subsp. violacea]|uniref:Excreted virulence factor EspC, type VII ESX diderm n=1 Tax=Lentzea albidocapillata subsp. violacea TaxID=128104 RepID=A0A1G8YGI9_9PSEU|nr:type VII secretion target [Lentzea albidocapillata]SDK01803.1 Excreted virulence factor EspC, type VII ESX diderm [Lentzea albidocapillata subsp. violacea]
MTNPGDGADMEPDAVIGTAAGVRSAADTFHSGFRSATAAGTRGLGQGPMGAAFLAGFNPGVESLNEKATQFVQGAGAIADGMHVSAREYDAADTRARDAVRQAGEADGRR